MTALPEQARKYAMRFLLKGRKAYINEYLLDDELPGFKLRAFENYDGGWLDYVGKCRKGIQDELYDVVSGSIADGKVFNTIDLYFVGAMSREDALGFFYNSDTYRLISEGVADMHCLSDEYPADELLMEWRHDS